MKTTAEPGQSGREPEQAANRLVISGRILERMTLRYTPAGVPVAEASLQHVSEVVEAGGRRRIELTMPLRALGDAARWLDAAEVGSAVEIDGFLAPKSLKSKAPVLHVNTLKFI